MLRNALSGSSVLLDGCSPALPGRARAAGARWPGGGVRRQGPTEPSLLLGAPPPRFRAAKTAAKKTSRARRTSTGPQQFTEGMITYIAENRPSVR